MSNHVFSRRGLLKAAGLAGGAVALAACAGPGGEAAPVASGGFDGPVEGELSFAHWRAEDKDVFDQVIAGFVQKNPKVTVRQDISASADYQSTALTKIRGGGTGDAFTAFRGAQFSNIASAGVWTDLTGQSLIGAYDPALITAGASGGKQLGLPYQLVFNMPVTNPELLAQHGYAELPRSWDGFLGVLDGLKGKGVTPIAWPGGDSGNGGQLINSMVMNNAPADDAFAQVEAGTLKVTDDWFLTTLKQYEQLKPYFQDGATGTANEAAMQLFATGKAAFLATGSYAAGPVRKLGARFPFGLYAPITVASGAKYEGIFNATFILGVNANSSKKAAALAWLAHLSDPAVASVYANGTSQHVTVAGVEYTNADLKAFAPWLTKKTLLAPRFQFNNLDVRTAVEEAAVKVVGGTEPEKAAEAAQRVVDQKR
ncbi:raffinose/stachyose/melibiose transport system substrate-binding protein [Catenuloplanes nepalensis]|uniref:Raffinose/stachyose/melibiose transport system substrate-binding protein n=1 Tax=Catenuloplanes nepalensis TaxID=587533 RepID=A0ABT9MYP9_9ACTN|nr:extracellular solute-binding protein [Catenuloplanes nepalensis]MDP9796543.1 raffinose/stachyose/melibiose transport system substrate-binding protein [Catenuloplanes nepalensis]